MTTHSAGCHGWHLDCANARIDELTVELQREQMERSDGERQLQSALDSGLRLLAERDALAAQVAELEAESEVDEFDPYHTEPWIAADPDNRSTDG